MHTHTHTNYACPKKCLIQKHKCSNLRANLEVHGTKRKRDIIFRKKKWRSYALPDAFIVMVTLFWCCWSSHSSSELSVPYTCRGIKQHFLLLLLCPFNLTSSIFHVSQCHVTRNSVAAPTLPLLITGQYHCTYTDTHTGIRLPNS